jgi:predicted MFS family arabinose efflux permease
VDHLSPLELETVTRWVRATVVVFLLMGLSFGTWISRLPSLRDELGASTLDMSLYGLCLAIGSLLGLLLCGRPVERIGPKRIMVATITAQLISLPGAALLMISGALPAGLVALFVFGFSFSTADIAMNVSGANAERAYGRPRLPLMHAFSSIGLVLSMVLGAVAETLRIPLPVHFAAVVVVIGAVAFTVLRRVPRNELELRARGEGTILDTSGAVPVLETASGDPQALTSATGSLPVIPHPQPAAGGSEAKRRYSPWRNPRVLLIGVIALSAGLIDGAAYEWLPLALVDGRGVSNEFGTVMLGLFFGSIVAARFAGSALLIRFGRVAVLRASMVCVTLGVLVIILVPSPVGMVLGTIAWGLGAGIGWPLSVSAAADDPDTAVRDVAAVSAIGYASMLLSPVAFGVLGEHIGLLQSFWLVPIFTLLALLLAGRTRPGAR